MYHKMGFPKIRTLMHTSGPLQKPYRKIDFQNAIQPFPTQRTTSPLTTPRKRGKPTTKKNIEDKQKKKLHKCSAELFIYTVVIAVKKDKTVKIALDSKKLNDAIHKNKFQLQSIGQLIDSVAVNISKKNIAGQFWFSKIDLKCAYSQIPLDDNITKHFNFNILSGKATGTCRFINGFFRLTYMLAIFQKTIVKHYMI